MKKIDLSSSDSEDLNECPEEDIKGKGKSKGKANDVYKIKGTYIRILTSGDGSGGSMTGESQRRDVMRAVVVTGFVTQLRQLMSSPRAPSVEPSTPPSYSSGPLTPQSYSSRPSTPPNYSLALSKTSRSEINSYDLEKFGHT
ncbi:hypothetical protein Tco_0969785 [Tanacetum coccineum]